MKVYNVSENSPVGQLINKIEAVATEKSLSLSRYQSNQGNHATNITYVVHTGDRQPKADDNNVVALARLTATEGSTEKSDAYRKLSGLLAELA